jgi:siroheme synthase
VVRLKIGDPFLFGRGGEEVEELAAHGIDVDVVPGITSAFSAPMGVGIPATMRGEADRISIFTAAGQGGSVPLPPAWHPSTTFIALMGMAALPSLTRSLRKRGFPADLPAACIVNASRPDEQCIIATLSELPEAVRRAGLKPPGVLVFGAVVAKARSQESAQPGWSSDRIALGALAAKLGDQAL